MQTTLLHRGGPGPAPQTSGAHLECLNVKKLQAGKAASWGSPGSPGEGTKQSTTTLNRNVFFLSERNRTEIFRPGDMDFSICLAHVVHVYTACTGAALSYGVPAAFKTYSTFLYIFFKQMLLHNFDFNHTLQLALLCN